MPIHQKEPSQEPTLTISQQIAQGIISQITQGSISQPRQPVRGKETSTQVTSSDLWIEEQQGQIYHVAEQLIQGAEIQQTTDDAYTLGKQPQLPQSQIQKGSAHACVEQQEDNEPLLSLYVRTQSGGVDGARVHGEQPQIPIEAQVEVHGYTYLSDVQQQMAVESSLPKMPYHGEQYTTKQPRQPPDGGQELHRSKISSHQYDPYPLQRRRYVINQAGRVDDAHVHGVQPQSQIMEPLAPRGLSGSYRRYSEPPQGFTSHVLMQGSASVRRDGSSKRLHAGEINNS